MPCSIGNVSKDTIVKYIQEQGWNSSMELKTPWFSFNNYL
jgi:hypothetical protein